MTWKWLQWLIQPSRSQEGAMEWHEVCIIISLKAPESRKEDLNQLYHCQTVKRYLHCVGSRIQAFGLIPCRRFINGLWCQELDRMQRKVYIVITISQLMSSHSAFFCFLLFPFWSFYPTLPFFVWCDLAFSNEELDPRTWRGWLLLENTIDAWMHSTNHEN